MRVHADAAEEGQVVQGSAVRPGETNAPGKVDLDVLIRRLGERYGLPPELLRAVIRQESAFDPFAVSKKGAQGLMQLMPGTARRFGVQDVFDPAENVLGGVKYLRFLLDRYEGDARLALAAYNAGEAAVDRYAGIPPYAETRDYVERIAEKRRPEGTAASDGEQEAERTRVVAVSAADGSLRFEVERE